MPITPVDYQPLPYVRSGTLGTLIGLRGQHQSEALLRAGEIQAKLWSDLGQNISQGVTSYAKQQQEAPQRAMTLKLDQARLNDEQAQADQRTAGAAEKSAFDTALKGAMRTDPDTGLVTYDRNKAQQLLVGANMGHLAPQINEILDKSDAADQALAKSHQDAIRASADLVDRLGNDPTLFAHEIQRGIQNRRYTEQDVAPYLEAAQTDPSNVAKITASILGKKPDLMPVPAGEPVIDKNNPSAGAVYTAPAKPAEPKQYQVTVPGPNGQPITRLATEDEMKAGVPTYRAPNAATDKKVGDLTPDAVEQGAARYRLLGASSIPTRIEEPDRVAIMNKAAEQDKALGNTPAASVQKMAAYKADTNALVKMRQMSFSAEAFETKALAQADLIDKLSAKTGRTDWPVVNKLVLSGKVATGDTNAQLLANAIIGFQSEYAKILEGSTGSVAAVGEGSAARAQQMVSAALSKGTLKETLAQMRWEMKQTMNGYDTVIGSITDRMGGTAPAASAPPAAAPPPAAGAAPTYQDYLKSRGAK